MIILFLKPNSPKSIQELVHVNLSFPAGVDTLRALQPAMLLECQHLLGNSGLHVLALVPADVVSQSHTKINCNQMIEWSHSPTLPLSHSPHSLLKQLDE